VKNHLTDPKWQTNAGKKKLTRTKCQPPGEVGGEAQPAGTEDRPAGPQRKTMVQVSKQDSQKNQKRSTEKCKNPQTQNAHH